MISAPIPVNESARLKAVEEYKLLINSLPEDSYRELIRMAAEVTGTPSAFIGLVGESMNGLKQNRGCILIKYPVSTLSVATPLLILLK
jgi:hypothetical protein